ncbi:MAG TPA: isoprenylcysteine carboxylmethyltransferase family protein [Gemmataceae bacterium]|nr:isoprenylcysteine carboxylmethyltransferase family protein [Gemmataceae bacterium]
MRWLELRIPPVPLAAAFGAAMFGVSRVFPAATFVIPGRAGLAIALAIVSAAVSLSGIVAFRANRTTVNPLKPDTAAVLVTRGSYRYSRNPMYLGFLLALTAWAIDLCNAMAVLFLPAFVAYMNRFQIEPEERALLAKFGTTFSEYMTAVRRWI